jgi:hypothetical protein
MKTRLIVDQTESVNLEVNRPVANIIAPSQEVVFITLPCCSLGEGRLVHGYYDFSSSVALFQILDSLWEFA